MPRLTIALDITASASTPGTRKSTGSLYDVLTASTDEKNTRIPSGITSVTSRLSPRRTVSSISMRVCARIAFAFMRPSRTAVAGEAQEDVFERPAARAQLAQQRTLLGQPPGDGGQELGRRRSRDQVVARPHLAHRAGRKLQARREVVDLEPPDGGEGGLVRGRARREL